MHDKKKLLRLTLLVVLYKTTEKKSSTLATLELISARSPVLHNSLLIIWDNSPCPSLHLVDFKGLSSVVRIHSPENRSLSRIYNFCIKQYSEMDAFCIFDQDTFLTNAYFSELINSFHQEAKVNCFLPIVQANSTGKIVSPGRLFWIKGKYWRKPRDGLINSRNVLALTSGMVIRASYLATKIEPFDTRLNLYGIDSKFMIDYAQECPFVYVLKARLNHGHSSSEIEPVETKVFRFLNCKQAWRIINSENFMKKWCYELYALYRSVRFAILYRDLGFLRRSP